MGFFEFKKWFFDVQNGEDDYLIFFVSQIKLGKKYFAYFQMHGALGEISCIKSFHHKGNVTNGIKIREGSIQFENGGCTIDLDFEDRINLVYISEPIDWSDHSMLLGNQKKKYLDWIPLILSGSVTGSITVSGATINYTNAVGYCDEVRFTFLPWKVPVKKLIWGRLLNKSVNLTFSIIQDSKTLQYVSKLFLDFKGNYYVLTGLSIDPQKQKKNTEMDLVYLDEYIIRGQNSELSIIIEISDHHEMILNDFMDYKKEYGHLATGILRRISHNPRGIKFWAMADVIVNLNDKEYSFEKVPLIDEYVEFH